jgi:hypothetical protein
MWINNPAGAREQRPWPAAPEDAVATLGHWGQFMLVVPSKKIIAVRTGDTRDGSFGMAKFANVVMAFVDKTPLMTLPKPNPPEKAVHVADTYFEDGMVRLGLRFTAKNFCSCLFVTQNSEENCRSYASLEQVSPRLSVDLAKKETQSSLFFVLSEKAVYKGPDQGCVLE